MTDFITRSPAPSAPTGGDQVTPTSFVTPTIQSIKQKPGQSVKPSLRQPVGQSLALTQLITQRSSHSLNRAFSLASADLLRSNGPKSFHANDKSPGQSDVVQWQREVGNGRERPLSAHLCGSIIQEDGSSLTTPIHHSSSLSMWTERYSEQERERGSVTASQNVLSASSHHHRGEVAMVTPVRAVPSSAEHGEVSREEQLNDSSDSKRDIGQASCGSIECPKSTPASPDPNNDPQTVWYEYGCV